MGRKRPKIKMTIKVNVKPAHKAARGHSAHRGGAGSHDSSPKRQRTRNAQRQNWMKDQA